ncbi:acetyltransferase [Buttiauxella gaviniae ATCC 51604]|uniref:Acetyltransferase n=2 Tax=Buttiauxella gaviniae TaxID=82990 RepID=A0A1B7HQU6_9ENTR|nr:acetyltransferase [Buttiauxella gaviniae ATCC 51604]
MLLRDVLKKENNNLDLIRIIAACLVIYGHAYFISPQAGADDFVRSLIGFDYSGSMAVKVFFFISGLVVTNSYFRKKDIHDFIISRFFRIWPALITIIVISYLYALIATTFSASEFMASSNPLDYLVGSFFLKFTWSFPGVFSNNPSSTFNGSLWSITYEVGCYIILMSIASLFKFNKLAISIICAMVIIDSVYQPLGVFRESIGRVEVKYLPACFAIGVISSIYQDKIQVNIKNLSTIILVTMILNAQLSSLYELSFYIAIMYSILFICSRKCFIKIKPKYDISYGIYLYGFPIQQIIHNNFKDYGISTNQLLSITISICAGLFSWILIEKRFMNIASEISRKITIRNTM